MKYAIIAAGEGSRLVQEGVAVPKPLVKVGGEHLIDRLIRIFMDCGASEICVICNEQMTAVAEHLQKIKASGRVPLRFVVKSTPSSMHSAWELSQWLKDEPFVLTTVDTIFREKEFKTYSKAFEIAAEHGDVDGLMGVTDYIDDEKPLYVDVDDSRTITAFLDSCDNPHYISGGIYGLTPKAIPVLQRCIERGESRMRNFQRALVAEGLHLKAYSFSKVLDIDHASDIQKAEDFLKMNKSKV
jgi:NDP-sugar pyrophosphorylase family protein